MNADRARRPVLTAAHEFRLAERIQRGDMNAMHEMIERNLGLVHAIARSYNASGVPFDDLVQEGTLGLMRAIDKFDHRRGFKLSTYAVWWIRRAMVGAINADRTIRIPSTASYQLTKVKRAEDELRREYPGSITDAAIAERTALGARTVAALRAAPQVIRSLDEPVGEDGMAMTELLADPDSVDAWEQIEENESRHQVWRMLSSLAPRHRRVIVARYGLEGDAPQAHSEIAKSLGVGEERSRQLEREALHWLRELRGGRESAALVA